MRDYMRGIINIAVRLIKVAKRTYARKWSFLGLFAVAFFSSVAVLNQMDMLPEKPPAVIAPIVTRAANQSDMPSVTASAQTVVELPMKIEIPDINLSAIIANPTTT